MNTPKSKLRSKFGATTTVYFLTAEEVALALNVSRERLFELREVEPEIFGPNSSRSPNPGKVGCTPLWSSDLVELLAAYREVDEYGNQLITREDARKARIGLSRRKRNHWLDIAELG